MSDEKRGATRPAGSKGTRDSSAPDRIASDGFAPGGVEHDRPTSDRATASLEFDDLLERWSAAVQSRHGRRLLDLVDEGRRPLYSAERLADWIGPARAGGERADDHAHVVRERRSAGASLAELLQEYDRLEDVLTDDPGRAGFAKRREGVRRLRQRAATDWMAALDAERGSRDRLVGAWSRLIRHDIKTPLQAALLNLEILQMEFEDRGESSEDVVVIRSSLEQAIEMLRDNESLG